MRLDTNIPVRCGCACRARWPALSVTLWIIAPNVWEDYIFKMDIAWLTAMMGKYMVDF